MKTKYHLNQKIFKIICVIRVICLICDSEIITQYDSSCKSTNPKNLDSENYTQYCMLHTHTLADSKPVQFNHPFTFLTTHYNQMNIITLQKFTCTIYAAHLYNLSTFPAQFVRILALFFQKFQTKILYLNTLTMQKLFFTCTNCATINPITTDYQTYSTCTISSITCTICTTKSHNHHIINKLKYEQMMHTQLNTHNINMLNASKAITKKKTNTKSATIPNHPIKTQVPAKFCSLLKFSPMQSLYLAHQLPFLPYPFSSSSKPIGNNWASSPHRSHKLSQTKPKPIPILLLQHIPALCHTVQKHLLAVEHTTLSIIPTVLYSSSFFLIFAKFKRYIIEYEYTTLCK